MKGARYIYYGMIAGFLAGLIVGGVIITSSGTLEAVMKELITESINGQLPPEEVNKTVETVLQIFNVMIYVSPIIYGIEMLLFGALFGLLHRWLVLSKNMGEVQGAIITGAAFIVIIELLPMGTTYLISPKQIEIISQALSPALWFLPGLTYLAILIFLSGVNGPWKKLGE